MKTEPARRCPPLVAFDVGIGRTYTALAVISRWSAERARRRRAAPEVDVEERSEAVLVPPTMRARDGEQDPEQA